MQIVGQKTLLDYINSKTLRDIPKVMLLSGEYGCGKFTISQYIAEHLNLEFENISDNISYEYICEIQSRVQPKLYYIDANKLTINQENSILKFIEEPTANSVIILTTTNKHKLLQTVVNRCFQISFEKYSLSELKTIRGDLTDDIYQALNTPGKLLKLDYSKFNDMISLIDKIINCIGRASFQNTLTISDKLAFNDDKNKFDFMLFTDLLEYRISETIKSNNNLGLINLFKLTKQLNNDKMLFNVDKRYLFDNYLCKIWLEGHTK